MKVISLAMQKGGIGKSTTSLTLANTLGYIKRKVLIVDFDPQGNSTYASDIINPEQTIYEVVIGECDIRQAIIKTKYYDIIPANFNLTNVTLDYKPTDIRLLDNKLKFIKNEYDYIIIDTPPTLGILLYNALMSSDYIVIPSEPSFFSLQGLADLWETIQAVQTQNPKLQVAGILITKHNKRRIIDKEVNDILEDFSKRMNTRIFKARISESTVVGQSQMERLPLIDYAPGSTATTDYIMFVTELLNLIEQ